MATPAAPVEGSHLNDGCGNGYDLAIDGGVSLLYLACGSGVQVIDIADPAAPGVVGRYDTGGNDSYTHVALRGDRAWFADTDGVHELDVADPTQPVQEIGRAHVRTPVPNAHLVCRLLLEKKKTNRHNQYT